MKYVTSKFSLPLLLLSFLATILPVAEQPVLGKTGRTISERDRAQLILSALRTTVPREDSVKNVAIFLVLREPVAAELLNDSGMHLQLIKEEEAEKRIRTKEGISFYRVQEFEFKRQKVEFSLEYKSGFKFGDSGYIKNYSYKKIAGNWKGKGKMGLRYCGASIPDKETPDTK